MRRKLLGWVEATRSSTLARNTAWMFLGQGMRLFVQAAYFIVIARTLGVHDYGAFVGVVALVAAFSPFVGNGASSLLVQNVSRDRLLFRIYWGNGIALILASGLVLSVLIVGLSHFVLPPAIPAVLVAMICLSDAILLPLLDLAGLAYQAFERLERLALLNVLSTLSRLCGALILALWVRHSSASTWGCYYAISTLVSSAFAVALTSRELGVPKIALRRIPKEAREGFYFAVGQSARTIYNDIDKTMLARLSTLESTGIYGAAYRLIDVSFAPIRSLLFAAYPRFFQYGEKGLDASFALTRRLLSRALVVSLAIFVLIWVVAPIVPRILGNEYTHTVSALRWLSLLPLLKAIHHLTADALTGAGYQVLRTFIQVFVAAFNVGINFWLIPVFGWHGAAWSSLASDGLLAVLIYLSVVVLRSWRRTSPALNEALKVDP